MSAHERRGKTVARWVKFNLVGGLGIGVQLLVLTSLRNQAHLGYLPATGLAVEAAVIHNFMWHESFTWADRFPAASFGRFSKFNLTTGLFSIAGNLALVRLLVGCAQLPLLPSNMLAIAACSLLNFLVSDWFVFRPSLPTEKRC